MLLRNKQLRDGKARNVQKELFPSTVVLQFSATTHNLTIGFPGSTTLPGTIPLVLEKHITPIPA